MVIKYILMGYITIAIIAGALWLLSIVLVALTELLMLVNIAGILLYMLVGILFTICAYWIGKLIEENNRISKYFTKEQEHFTELKAK